MVGKYVCLVGLGLVAGFSLSAAIQRESAPQNFARNSIERSKLQLGSDTSALRSYYELYIAELERNLQQVQREASDPLLTSTPAEMAARVQANLRKELEWETGQLLAAGFSEERIEWIRNRARKLIDERPQSLSVDSLERPIDPDEAMAYVFDPDLALRHEIGDDEYERYRVALGRPAGIDVTEVLPGSIASSVGIQAGDEILTYSGQRVFNMGELNAIARKDGAPGEKVVVEVRRQGQVLRLIVPRGHIGIHYKILPPRLWAAPQVQLGDGDNESLPATSDDVFETASRY